MFGKINVNWRWDDVRSEHGNWCHPHKTRQWRVREWRYKYKWRRLNRFNSRMNELERESDEKLAKLGMAALEKITTPIRRGRSHRHTADWLFISLFTAHLSNDSANDTINDTKWMCTIAAKFSKYRMIRIFLCNRLHVNWASFSNFSVQQKQFLFYFDRYVDRYVPLWMAPFIAVFSIS